MGVDSIRGFDLKSGVQGVEGVPAKPNGSSVTPVYRHRAIAYYPVTDDELDQITAFNKVSAALFSAGSFILGWTIDFGKDLYLGQAIDPDTKISMTVVTVSGAVLTAVCYAIALYFWSMKSKMADKIKLESVGDS